MARETGLVQSLRHNEIFVFGSNEAGRHGRGAAKLALSFGAKRGVGIGRGLVDEFLEFAATHAELTFLVTEIGCGLAGYTPSEVAPFFARAADMTNVHLPASFWAVLRAKACPRDGAAQRIGANLVVARSQRRRPVGRPRSACAR